MSVQKIRKVSALTKLQHSYWEAKQSFNTALGNKDDDCIISSDAELDARIQLLKSADNYFNALMSILLSYRDCLVELRDSEENLGSALIEYGIKDATYAGKLMSSSGKVLSRIAQRQSSMKTIIMKLFHEVQTFQFKATSDALQSVGKMEKARRAYRSGLMWMKKESVGLDPDVTKKIKNFRRVQDHIKNLKGKFDALKLESMQKIDLFILSRSNLFSQALLPYHKTFCKTTKSATTTIDSVLRKIPLHLCYNFKTVKELNSYANLSLNNLYFSQSLSKTQKSNIAEGNLNNENSKIMTDNVCSNKKLLSYSETNLNSKKNRAYQNYSKDKLVPLLVDFNEEVFENSTTSTPFDPSTSNYSSDLKFINLKDQYEDIKNASILQNEYLTGELENCMELFNSLSIQSFKSEPQDLSFWNLMENLESKNTGGKNYSKIKENVLMHCDEKTEIDENSQNKTELANILIEFDPFCSNRTKSESDKMRESC